MYIYIYIYIIPDCLVGRHMHHVDSAKHAGCSQLKCLVNDYVHDVALWSPRYARGSHVTE